MQVLSKRQGRKHRWWWVLAFTGLVGVAHAAGFDEKLKAPMMKSTAEFRTQAQPFAKKFAEVRAATPAQLITNDSLAREQFDLKWQVGHAIDTRKPLDGLADLGLVSRGDGSISVDTNAHPEWLELSQVVYGMLLPDNLGNTTAGLVQRGFRSEDLAVLNEYLAGHNMNAAAAAANLPISLGFGRTVNKLDQLKKPVPDSLVFSYWYQRARASSEAERVWAQGLLKSFDAQRQRALLSIALESRTTSVWSPEDIASGISDMLFQARRPDFEQRVTAEAQGVAP